MENERFLGRMNIVALIVIFAIGCFCGKISSVIIEDSWVVFNGTAIGVIIIGEFIWRCVRNYIAK